MGFALPPGGLVKLWADLVRCGPFVETLFAQWLKENRNATRVAGAR